MHVIEDIESLFTELKEVSENLFETVKSVFEKHLKPIEAKADVVEDKVEAEIKDEVKEVTESQPEEPTIAEIAPVNASESVAEIAENTTTETPVV